MGGSTSVGLYSIQIASLYGFDVVTTCSPHNAELVRSYGAKYVFDYKDEKVAEEIRKVAPNIYHVFDTVGNQGSSPTASIAARLV
ncbi:zinc binding dehydrogenase [Aspergillus flavus]|uniref:Zinc binding dehydrogenase n=1 Tax=Aspergillus flavus TaxID=5059 RepID=A0AB74CAY2_ASPFL|nr:zinc binding dehydrogenase [Aspergillus flavus]RMZ43421.1 zinc binding dehydrogenase [Aspergillus flavus]